MKPNDKLVPLLRAAFIPLLIVTAIFGPLLVLFPGGTSTYWAWEIRPDMSAVWVGAGYTFGAMAIATMLWLGKWRGAIVPIIGTWPFSIVMFAATFLHLDRFFVDTPRFYVWLAIYVGLPVALPLIWWLNSGQDPGPEVGEMHMPRTLSQAAGVVGIVLILVSLLMVFSPSTAASFWPWQLTPLMSRVIGGWVLFGGTGLACLFFERRYIAYRYFLICAGIWMAILFVASFFHLDNFDFNRTGSWLWFVLVGGFSAAAFALYVYLENLYRRSRDVAVGARSAVTG